MISRSLMSSLLNRPVSRTITPTNSIGSSLFCSTCNVYCSSADNLNQHFDGAQHRRKTSSNTNGFFYCQICDIDCSCHDSLVQHIKGQSHSKRVTRNSISHFSISQATETISQARKQIPHQPQLFQQSNIVAEDDCSSYDYGSEHSDHGSEHSSDHGSDHGSEPLFDVVNGFMETLSAHIQGNPKAKQKTAEFCKRLQSGYSSLHKHEKRRETFKKNEKGHSSRRNNTSNVRREHSIRDGPRT